MTAGVGCWTNAGGTDTWSAWYQLCVAQSGMSAAATPGAAVTPPAASAASSAAKPPRGLHDLMVPVMHVSFRAGDRGKQAKQGPRIEDRTPPNRPKGGEERPPAEPP